MSRRKRGSIEHSMLNDLPEGVAAATDIVRKLNESEQKAKVESAKPVDSDVRNLVLFGKITTKIELGGFIFKISTLTNRQQNDLMKRLLGAEPDERLGSVKIFTLAKAIRSVNEQSLPDLYDSIFGDDDEDDLSDWDKSLEVLSEFQNSLIDNLHLEYNKLVEKSNKLFERNTLEDSVKN